MRFQFEDGQGGERQPGAEGPGGDLARDGERVVTQARGHRPRTRPHPARADLEVGEENAYAIRLTAKDSTPVGRPTWARSPSTKPLQRIEALLSVRFSLLS
ncbi:hypothetical protein [Actinomadura rugatobispora]|uniref:Uncharacterized protein n=1 Tax=Actinomadura rugatobispora TaxID=1994 RepID=A0ABW0ZYE6_9ACTN|nr:hypothetical protein GCM10010200_098880 [Actinomadura rugatobispora]